MIETLKFLHNQYCSDIPSHQEPCYMKKICNAIFLTEMNHEELEEHKEKFERNLTQRLVLEGYAKTAKKKHGIELCELAWKLNLFTAMSCVRNNPG